MPSTKTISVEDVVQWILKHRKGKAFDWPDNDIRNCLLDASDKGTLMLDVNNKNEIFGVMIYEPVIYINQILCTHKYSFQNILNSMLQKFPGYGCFATRKGKLKRYKISRTMQLINKD